VGAKPRRPAPPACITSPSSIPTASLADALRRLIEHKVPLDGAADHGVSEAIYLQDPDGNGIELYTDRDPAAWPRDAKGELAMTTGAA
jgi:catechol 2,3-dioxygenase